MAAAPAPTPSGSVKVIVGADVKPVPPLVMVTPVTTPPTTVATPVAPVPPPPVMVTIGGVAAEYPDPPLVMVITERTGLGIKPALIFSQVPVGPGEVRIHTVPVSGRPRVPPTTT